MYLVTGSTGFVGGSICRALIARGERVRAFHRPTSSLALLAGLDPARLEHAVGDITDPESLRAAMKGVDAVFHAAARLGSSRHHAQMYEVTVGGTRNLLQAAQEAGVKRVVHTSSVAALGVPGRHSGAAPPMLMDETHTWNYRPAWWRYGHAKYLAELEVQKAVAKGLEVVIVNPGVILGPGDIHRVGGDVVIQVARRGIPVAVPGGLNVIHIDDVVRGQLAALETGRTGERYILGNENLSIPHFLQLIAEVTGVRPPRWVLPVRLVRLLAGLAGFLNRWLRLPVNPGLLRMAGHFFYYNTTKAQNELGLVDLRRSDRAIEETYAWYQAHGMI